MNDYLTAGQEKQIEILAAKDDTPGRIKNAWATYLLLKKEGWPGGGAKICLERYLNAGEVLNLNL